MERRKFLGTLSAPVLAACAVCAAGCSKSGGSGGTTGGGVIGGAANFTVDLNSSITTVGSSTVQNGVIVVRLAAGNTPSSFTAVQAACTHEGTTINYNSGQTKFICPNHGSTFSTAGAVTLGPATTDLKVYNIVINGTIMTVSG